MPRPTAAHAQPHVTLGMLVPHPLAAPVAPGLLPGAAAATPQVSGSSSQAGTALTAARVLCAARQWGWGARRGGARQPGTCHFPGHRIHHTSSNSPGTLVHHSPNQHSLRLGIASGAASQRRPAGRRLQCHGQWQHMHSRM